MHSGQIKLLREMEKLAQKFIAIDRRRHLIETRPHFSHAKALDDIDREEAAAYVKSIRVMKAYQSILTTEDPVMNKFKINRLENKIRIIKDRLVSLRKDMRRTKVAYL